MTESIIQWNIRGIFHNMDGLHRILADKTPMSVCLQETLLRPGQTPRIRGYKIYSKDVQPAPGGRAHGGVGILIRENVSYKTVSLNTNLQAIAVRLAAPFQITLACLYLPNNQWWRGDLEELLRQLPPPVLLMGDFNSHNTWWGSARTDARGRDLEEVIDNTNLLLLNNGAATHFNAGLGTFSAIDLSFASPATATRLDWTPMTELYQSDHFPIIVSCSISKVNYVFPEKFDVRKADWAEFSANLVTPLETGNVHRDCLLLTEAIHHAASASIKRVGGRMTRPPVPWWTQECKIANAEKKRAFNRMKRYPTVENLIKFKRLRARERAIIKKSKMDSLSAYVTSITTSTTTRQVWDKIRNLSGGRRLPSVPALRIEEAIITEPLEVAECFARHFQQVSSTSTYSNRFLLRKRDEEQTPLDFSTSTLESYNEPLTLDELNHALNSSRDTSPGIDELPNALIRNLPHDMKLYLLKLFNRIWESGVYPEGWREALVIPIPKEGKDLSLPSSYRPISLTTCLSKILENIINQRLVFVLESRGFYSQHQAGFRRFHSTLDQLSHLEVYVQNAFMRREHVLAVFFDLEKAYDTTWRHGILRKCHEFGLKGNMPRFLQSFLEARRFRVRIGATLSRSHVQENGIPQGSILSVTLFGMAVNNIADAVSEPLQKSLYVDDLAIFLSGNNIGEMAETVQRAVNQVADEAEYNGFKFSEEKTVCVHFCRLRTEHISPQLYLKGAPIQYKEYVRFLGLIFDNKLSWEEHINNVAVISKKSLSILKFLANYKWGTEREILKRIFTMVICPKLEYGSPIYSSARKTRLRKLDRIYNQAVRIILGAFRTSPINSLYVEAGIVPPDLRREQQTLNYVAAMWGKPQHFLHPTFFNGQYDEEYRRQRTRTRPLSIRAMSIMETEEIQLDSVMQWSYQVTPPWTLTTARVRLDLTSDTKSDTPPVVYKTKFYQLLNELQGYRPIYTDGSKINNGVGCAVYTEGVTRTWTLPQYTSVYTAEMIAICQALVLCRNLDSTRFLICSDSLSILTALRNKFSFDPAVTRCYQLLQMLHMNGKEATFLWVPGHVGIPGNEEADAAAKLAATSPLQEVISVHPTDTKLKIKQYIRNKWQANWDAACEKLYDIKPSVLAGSISSQNRRENVVLTRLRIGHTRLTHGHLLIGRRPRRCSFCRERMTVYHVLEGCQALRTYRDNAGLTHDMCSTLNDGTKTANLFNFLRTINYFNDI